MQLIDFPTEILLLIAEQFETFRDISNLGQTTHDLYNILNPYLYKRSVDDSRRGLAQAVVKGHVGSIQKFIDAGAKTYIQESICFGNIPRQWPLICLAAYEGHAEIVQLLLDNGANPNAVSKMRRIRSHESNYMPLHLAASKDRLDIMKILLAADGIFIDPVTDMRPSPMIYACEHGSLEMVKMLVERGVGWKVLKTNSPHSPLSYAAIGSHYDVVRYFLDKGADPNYRDPAQPSALMLACKGGDRKVIKALLDKGADPSARDEEGDGPLSIAAAHGHLDMMKLLVEYGAVATGSSPGETNLPMNCEEEGNQECLELLLKLGVGVNDLDVKGWGALHRAAHRNDIRTAQFLLDHGADLEMIADEDTPLYSAVYGQAEEMFDFLLEKGANPDTLPDHPERHGAWFEPQSEEEQSESESD
ncbi:uncharacterized protein N7459_009939 [Penicillium hispanicum]|uniref:uncharacterized protein n=1 Tax=Penicillium hispanicum TaxID=1080232 RepID=UPI0025405204|nr:uncharacterized protein N7459_009939 [Penicillium hispanicum]KAJ5570509.1 hypothetical protein N7459_009939 [Penicillium hispanicum]